jgi:general secretion pathway protein F
MSGYRYRAIAAGGTVVTGVIDAPNEAEVIALVRGLGHYPISASLVSTFRIQSLLTGFRSKPRVSRRRLMILTQELATLLQAQLDLDQALSILERLGDLGPLQKSVVVVRTRVHNGDTFADALAAEPVFPKLFIGMVRAGEAGGTLETTLQNLSQYLSRTATVRESIASALLYPIILLITAGFSIIFILTFVLPEFEPLFREAGRTLPWPTRLVVSVADFVRGYWWLLLFFASAVVLSIWQALQKLAVRLRFAKLFLRVPILGPLLGAIDIERFSRTLGTLLANGISLPTALPLAGAVIGNSGLSAAIAESATGLREGDGFSERLSAAELFPPATLDLIRVGEATGKLDEVLIRQADLDEQRVRHSIDRLLAILVPGLTILLGVMVGALIASLLTAILSINDLALPK